MKPKFYGTDDCTYYRASNGEGFLIQDPGGDVITAAPIPESAVELSDSVLDEGHYNAAQIIEEGR